MDILLIVLIVCALAVLWLLWMLLRPEFFKEMSFLNMEISRTKGEEQKKWIRQRKRLLLTLIPFVRYKR